MLDMSTHVRNYTERTEDKKYILTNQTITVDDITYHRIVAIKNFGDVKAGDLGGWIDTEESLSQRGNCWIYNNAKAAKCRIMGNVVVKGNATLYQVKMGADSKVAGNVWVMNSTIYNSYVAGNITVENSTIRSSKVTGHGTIDRCALHDAIVKNLPEGEAIRNSLIGKNALIKSMWDVVNIDGCITFYKGVDGKVYKNGESLDQCREHVMCSGNTRILKLYAGAELMLS